MKNDSPCFDARFVTAIRCILSYNGRVDECAMNCAIWGVTSLSCARVAIAMDGARWRSKLMCLAVCSAYVACHQVLYCFLTQCSGIAYVWNASAGFLVPYGGIRFTVRS